MSVRAFLSHATSDKHFVQKVAEQLGRAAVVFDAYEFSTGDDLRDAILKGIDKAGIFVLFASKAALSRDWVVFEIDEAQKASLNNNISQVLTYVIDPNLMLDELPAWLKSSLITRHSSPSLVASDIRRAVSARLAERRQKHFIGRSNELEQSIDLITSYTSADYRPPLVIYGLSGIGRRSLVDAIARDGLSLKRTHVVQLKEGDLLPELFVKLVASLAGDQPRNLSNFLSSVISQSEDVTAGQILDSLRSICVARAMPVILDDGALVTEDGLLRSEFEYLYNLISADPTIDMAIVSNRRVSGVDGKSLPAIRIAELTPAASVRLVRLLARDRNIPLSSSEADTVAEYSRGYPPAVMFAVQEMEAYGPAYVAASRATLSKFSEEIFLRKLQSDKKISVQSISILQLLSTYSPLPLPIIRDYLEIADDALLEHMEYLLDFALIVPEGVNYRISEPVRQAAYRAFRGLHLNHGKVADLLEGYLEIFDGDDTRFSLGQNLFRSATLSGRSTSSGNVVRLASDLIELAVRSYHDQDYDRAIEVGNLAIDARPGSVNVRRFVAQALIRRERYDRAQEHIDDLQARGHIKEAFYVRGFMHRRKRDHNLAIENYEKSLEYGRSGVPIHRELASCYFEVGNLPKARAQIEVAERLSPHNKYVVDLQCQIAIRLGDLVSAEKALAVLSRVDDSGFYEHRKSTYEQARGDMVEALRLAKIAVDERPRPQFEMLANLANCQIEMGEYEPAAATIKELDTRFPQTHRDSRLGMRCKLEIKRGDIATAEGLWGRIRTPETGVHMGLRAALLSKKSQKSPLTEAELTELDTLRTHFKSIDGDKEIRFYGSELTNSDI